MGRKLYVLPSDFPDSKPKENVVVGPTWLDRVQKTSADIMGDDRVPSPSLSRKPRGRELRTVIRESE